MDNHYPPHGDTFSEDCYACLMEEAWYHQLNAADEVAVGHWAEARTYSLIAANLLSRAGLVRP